MDGNLNSDASKEEKKDENNAFDWALFRQLTKQAWFIGASYFFSMEVFAVGLLPGLLGLNNQTGATNVTSYDARVAGNTLAPVVFNTIVIIVESTMFAYNVVLSGDLGRLKDLEDALGAEEITNLKLRISATNRNGIIWALVLCPFAMLPLYYSADLLIACGQDPLVAQEAQIFLRPSAFSIPALYLALAFEKIAISFRHTLATMLIGLASFIVGTATAVCLNKSMNLGMYGIAAVYGISNYLAMTTYALYLGLAKGLREYQFFNFKRLGCGHFSQLTDILKMGLPMMASTTSDNIISLLLSVFAGIMGEKQLAGLSATMSSYYFIFILSGSHAESSCQQVLPRWLS